MDLTSSDLGSVPQALGGVLVNVMVRFVKALGQSEPITHLTRGRRRMAFYLFLLPQAYARS